MVKEVITPVPKKTAPKVSYEYAGKESLGQAMGKNIPKQLIPTKRMSGIIGTIFLLVLIISAIQFPFGKMMAGDADISIEIGFPWAFIELGISKNGESMLNIVNLILSLLLYTLLAYGIEISLNLILKNPLLQSKEEIKEKPAIFKDRKTSIVEKAAIKATEKVLKTKI